MKVEGGSDEIKEDSRCSLVSSIAREDIVFCIPCSILAVETMKDDKWC